MKPHKALKQIMDTRKLKRVDIAGKAGIPANELSRYLSGTNDVLGNRLMSVIKALPIQAQIEFIFLLSAPEEGEDEELLAS